ncbi:hypothetical protein ES705_20584 [subsurface metagenome]
MLIIAPNTYLNTARGDPEVGYGYHIDNKSDKELKLYFKGPGYNDSPETIIAMLRAEQLFYEIDVCGKNPYDEKDDFEKVVDLISESIFILLFYHRKFLKLKILLILES